ncbi:fibroblast growth factor receptor substrate 3 [Neopelma chrysocephalum]|uniref:fibroblast growth factor receptor substrate 3 n=1 Tax=Neopelma chrysocephalum TaxID=114329 RepID=UPI000FCD1E6C|nr:fibroblast growth factor receptor substrate 3 [Neopelma chrysocephalum]
MGSCCSCLCTDSIPDNHPTKFKVTNVDDEGHELGSGIMELTQRELILHTHKRDAVRWPFLCLRRYGYDSNLFSFESGRRCHTGQGIFAFKCSRAEEIFNLLQDLMQCNSINVVEEPVVITRNSHPTERELSRTPQAPNSLGYTVPGFPNGFHSFPGESLSYSSARHPSVSSLRYSSVGEDSTHPLLGPEEQSHTYVNTASGEQEPRGRHCMHSLPEAHPPFPPRNHSRSLEDRNPQVFLQPGEVKFVLGPSSGSRRACRHPRECGAPLCPPNNNNNECEGGCPSPQCVYENLNGPAVPGGGSSRCRAGMPRMPRQDGGCSRRRSALLHYENLPALPPVWELQPSRRDEAAPAPSPGGFSEEDPLRSRPTNSRRSGSALLPRPRRSPRLPGVFGFELLPRPRAEPPRQLNYIQVELEEAEPGEGHREPPRVPPPAPCPGARRTDSYAVIDLKKTAAMSSLQRALPRDDGTSRKTRHNSTDLPL